ncbi:MAG: tRNA (guanine10-N2)-dimethyltransferase [Archaeoglobi archaeon]|nr:methyltransferase domain-containing protein [Candidatus Mnemosynella bozhongmuii]MDK2782408.1 tRNA (guanine10-N2)-dimethyltransferase [Archaeoglobi archaeon]
MEEKSEVLCFEVSQEHPTLPKSEILAVTKGEIIEEYPGAIIIKVRNPDYERIRKLGMTRRVSKVLFSGDFTELLGFCREFQLNGSFRVRAVKKRSDVSASQIERTVGGELRKEGMRVDLSSPDHEFRVIIGERFHLCLMLFECERKELMKRKPHKMPFFHPGVMLPQFSRALVNISEAKKGEIILDPFCGTGGILREAEDLSLRGIGVDISPKIIFGARKNVSSELILGDAKTLPLRSSSVHSVVSDFPYGRSSALSDPVERLYPSALEEIHRVLKSGRRAVIVTNKDIRDIVIPLFKIEEIHRHRVHGTLTRYFWVLRK